MDDLQNSIIVSIRLIPQEIYGEKSNIAVTIFDLKSKEYEKDILREGNVRYSKNNESIETLLSQRRQLPKATASNAFNGIIKQYKEFVKPQKSGDDKGAMKADRSTYMTARELLLQAMSDEEMKKSEVYPNQCFTKQSYLFETCQEFRTDKRVKSEE